MAAGGEGRKTGTEEDRKLRRYGRYRAVGSRGVMTAGDADLEMVCAKVAGLWLLRATSG
jgi:hypothetical protein